MRYVGQRLLQFLLVFIIVTFTVMAVTRIGLDGPRPRPRGRGRQRGADPAGHGGLPVPRRTAAGAVRYWLKDILTGDWGYSYIASQSTIEMFQQRMPTTVFIVLWAIVIGLLDRRARSACTAPTGATRGFDRGTSVSSFAVISTPPLVIAVVFLFLVVSRFEFFPSVGRSRYVAPWDNPIEHFKNFFIPSVVLGIGLGAVWSRLLRADMILTLQSDSISMAGPRGSRRGACLWRPRAARCRFLR